MVFGKQTHRIPIFRRLAAPRTQWDVTCPLKLQMRFLKVAQLNVSFSKWPEIEKNELSLVIKIIFSTICTQCVSPWPQMGPLYALELKKNLEESKLIGILDVRDMCTDTIHRLRVKNASCDRRSDY